MVTPQKGRQEVKPGEHPPEGVTELVVKLAESIPRPTNRSIRQTVKERLGVEIKDDRTIRRYCEAAGVPTSSLTVNRFQELQGTSGCKHENQFRALLDQWLNQIKDMTLMNWLQMMDDRLLSPPALLQAGRVLPQAISQKETEEHLSHQQLEEVFLEGFAPDAAMPATPSVIRSPLFPLLSEHLEGDSVWNQWNSLSLNLRKLSLRAWLAAYQLTSYVVGWLQSLDDSPLQASGKSRAAADQQVLDGFRRLAEDPAYRDGFAKILKPMVYLLGSELLRNGLRESEFGPEARAIDFALGLYIMQVEDTLQRVEKTQWPPPYRGTDT